MAAAAHGNAAVGTFGKKEVSMAQKRLSMRKIAEILRLKHQAGLSNRQIGSSCGVGHPTVSKYLSRAAAAGIGWPLPADMHEEQLHRRLFPESGAEPCASRPLPDMEAVHRQLHRPHVTLQLLWEEYREAHPSGYGYTQFCEHYKRWKAPLSVTLRQHHVAGEKTFLDWAGKTAYWIDHDSGQKHPAFLFVAVLGASDYSFVTACADQRLPCWIDAHIQMVEFYGGVTRLWVPDNAKTGVDKACYYEPQIHQSYQELADHYGTAILPTRTYAPRDKAKVENAVLIAERRILARLRDQTFGA
jgi:transposase